MSRELLFHQDDIQQLFIELEDVLNKHGFMVKHNSISLTQKPFYIDNDHFMICPVELEFQHIMSVGKRYLRTDIYEYK